jgi:hypothetical protein
MSSINPRANHATSVTYEVLDVPSAAKSKVPTQTMVRPMANRNFTIMFCFLSVCFLSVEKASDA